MADALIPVYPRVLTPAPVAAIPDPYSVRCMLDLLAAATDGVQYLILTFNRPPAGPVLDPASYTIEPLDEAADVAVEAATLGSADPGEYPRVVRLRLTHQGTRGARYRISVAGLHGGSGEVQGDAWATWTAVAIAPNVVSADVVDRQHVRVWFDAALANAGSAAAWTVQPVGGGDPVPVTGIEYEAGALDATLAVALDPGTYQITAPAGLTDQWGNALQARTATVAASAFCVQQARALSEQALLVTFSQPVRQADPGDPADALCLDNWTLTIPGQELPDLLDVVPTAEAGMPADPASVVLRWAGPCGYKLLDAVITATGVQSEDGEALVEPTSAKYQGVAAPIRPSLDAEQQTGIQDLRTPPGEAPSLEVGPAGDYVLASSLETIRELVLRAMSTAAGAWMHLPNYGAAPRMKRLGSPAVVQEIVRAARRAVVAVPGVQDASVTATVAPTGVLILTALVQTEHYGATTIMWAQGDQ